MPSAGRSVFNVWLKAWLKLVVPSLVITFELAFLTVLPVFNVVELLVAYIDLGVLNENVPLNIFSTMAGNAETPLSRLCKKRV